MIRLLNIVLLITSIMLIASCGDDEPTTEPSLMGDWALVSLDADIESTVSFLGAPITTAADVSTSNEDFVYTITDDEIIGNGTYDVTVITSLAGQVLSTETETITETNLSVNYTIDGNTISLEGNAFDFDVDEFDLDSSNSGQVFNYEFNGENEVVFRQNQVVQVEDPDTQTTIDVSVTAELVLRRN